MKNYTDIVDYNAKHPKNIIKQIPPIMEKPCVDVNKIIVEESVEFSVSEINISQNRSAINVSTNKINRPDSPNNNIDMEYTDIGIMDKNNINKFDEVVVLNKDVLNDNKNINKSDNNKYIEEMRNNIKDVVNENFSNENINSKQTNKSNIDKS